MCLIDSAGADLTNAVIDRVVFDKVIPGISSVILSCPP